MSAELEQLRELPQFLNHNVPEVRLQALTLLMSFTLKEEHRKFLQEVGIIKPLIKLLSDDKKDISRLTILCLINCAESEGLRQQMYRNHIADYVMACLREKDHPFHYLLVLLLSNISIDPNGAKSMMKEGDKAEGFHIIRLAQWFCQPPVACNPTEAEKKSVPSLNPTDTFQQVAYILTNVSQLASGRKLLTDKDRGILKKLLQYISSENSVRKMGVLTTIRNLALDNANHPFLLSEDLGLLSSLLVPIAGPEHLDEDDKQGMLPEVYKALTPKKTREIKREARLMILEVILIFVRNKASRHYLKQKKVYYLLRELHKWEQSLGNKQMDDFIEELVPYFILDEEPDPLPATAPAAAATALPTPVPAVAAPAITAPPAAEQEEIKLSELSGAASGPVPLNSAANPKSATSKDDPKPGTGAGSFDDKKPGAAEKAQITDSWFEVMD